MRSNAELVEYIRAEVHRKGNSVTDLEKACGLSNGRIGKWAERKGSPPHSALCAIADYLEVSLSELTGEHEQKENSPSIEIDEEAVEIAKLILNLSREQREREKAYLRQLSADAQGKRGAGQD